MPLSLSWEYDFTFEAQGEDHLDVRTDRFWRGYFFHDKMTIDIP